MKRIVIAIGITMCVAWLASVATADTLIMRDGTRIDGTVVGIVARTITFLDLGGVSRRFRTSQVESVQFSATPDERTAGRGMNGNNGYNGNNGNNGNSANNRNNTVGVRTLEAPAGTELVVRTTELIDSKTAKPEQTFGAIFEQSLTDASGRVIIPQRSTALLVIRQMSGGGATGSPEMILDVKSITVSGRRYLVSTTDLPQDNDTGIGKNKRTAEAIGGGAAIGSIIGAIAGGGKGAAIGGVIGAAGGAGAQVLTRGHDVLVPAETVLHFRLDQPVTLQAER